MLRLNNTWSRLPEATSNRQVVELRLPTARILPSGLNTGRSPPVTGPVLSTFRRRPSATRHNRTALPYPPVARSRPSGLKAGSGCWFFALSFVVFPVRRLRISATRLFSQHATTSGSGLNAKSISGPSIVRRRHRPIALRISTGFSHPTKATRRPSRLQRKAWTSLSICVIC